MGLLDRFRTATQLATRPGPTSSPRLASPWSADTLAKVTFSELFEPRVEPVTRAVAMKVPAIVKGRALITGTLARQPLAKFRGAERIPAEAWMYRTSTHQSPRTRMLWTLDDLLFYGTSLWAVERGARDAILDAVRIPWEWWEVDADLKLLVNGEEVDRDSVVYIEGPQDGLLEIAADDIRAARAMARAWSDRVEHPAPPAVLKTTDANVQLEAYEAQELVDAYDAARAAGGTAYLPHGLDVAWPQAQGADLYVEGRNASRLDFANYLGLPASLLEGSTATASLTYSTKEGSRNELVDYSLAYWANPIEARLSQDDVVPAGSRVAFDLEYLSAPTQPAQSPALED